MYSGECAQKVVSPAVNIYSTEKDIILEAEMTGLKKEDLTIDVKGDELTIKGTKQWADTPDGYTPVYREICPFEYSRTFILSDEVKRDGITAKYESGVLKLTIPKSEKAQPKRITVSD